MQMRMVIEGGAEEALGPSLQAVAADRRDPEHSPVEACPAAATTPNSDVALSRSAGGVMAPRVAPSGGRPAGPELQPAPNEVHTAVTTAITSADEFSRAMVGTRTRLGIHMSGRRQRQSA